MKDQLNVALTLSLFLFTFLAYAALFGRWRAKQEVIPFEPRRMVPWTGVWVLGAAVLYLGLAAGANFLAGQAYLAGLSQVERAAVVSDPSSANTSPVLILTVLQTDSAAKLFTVAILALLLYRWRGATADDLGIAMRRIPARIAQGAFVFFLVAPPTLLLQLAIVEGIGIKYDHPLIEAVKTTGDRAIIYWSTFAAVAVAPIVEEFLFRGVLLGWLERDFSLMRRRDELAAEEALFANEGMVTLAPIPTADGPVIPAGSQVAQTRLVSRPSFTPLVVSAMIFSAVHLPQYAALLPLFLFGLGLGFLYRQTHSIWPSVVMHFLLNAFSMTVLLMELK